MDDLGFKKLYTSARSWAGLIASIGLFSACYGIIRVPQRVTGTGTGTYETFPHPFHPTGIIFGPLNSPRGANLTR